MRRQGLPCPYNRHRRSLEASARANQLSQSSQRSKYSVAVSDQAKVGYEVGPTGIFWVAYRTIRCDLGSLF